MGQTLVSIIFYVKKVSCFAYRVVSGIDYKCVDNRIFNTMPTSFTITVLVKYDEFTKVESPTVDGHLQRVKLWSREQWRSVRGGMGGGARAPPPPKP